ncbi:hypothetical protein HID58_086671 [Brassica napus]|uniref:Uncharacterized protein n=1 Tax=Brassica napus TaxID=3708 RepID=A0ABQ7XR14_BRANA|nr:hypothetical protein HID58_086671 [Brassica napus]
MIRFIFTNRPDQHRRPIFDFIPVPGTILPAHPPSSIRPSIPIPSSSPFVQSNLPPLPPSSSSTSQKVPPVPAPPSLLPAVNFSISKVRGRSVGAGSPPNTLTEPVWDTVKKNLSMSMIALRDWDLWGPFFFIVFLGLMLSWSPSVKKAKASLDSGLLLAFDLTQRTDSHLMSMIRYAINHIVKFTIKCCSHSEVFAVAFALLAAVAVILTLNVSSPRRSICGFKKVKLGELEADLFAIKAINDNLYPSYNELVEFRSTRNCSYTGKSASWFRITHVIPAKLEETMKEEDWRGYFLSFVGNKDSVVQINGVGDMSLKSLMKHGFLLDNDIFICGIKFLNFQKKVKEKRTFDC